LTVALFAAETSVLEEEAPRDREARGSFPYTAWKRDTVVFNGTAVGGVGVVLVGASGNARSKSRGVGVGGGDMNATFFCTSSAALVFEAPFAETEPFVLRELRGVDSDVFADESCAFSSVCRGIFERFGVDTLWIERKSAWESEGDDWIAGRGLDESCEVLCEGKSSGRGLNDANEAGTVDVDVGRWESCGGQDGRGGNFSLGAVAAAASRSLSFAPLPMWRR
jgi:hypothetical protein